MGSSRLPNKMLLHLHGFPICEWVFRRVQKSEKIDEIIFAIPDSKDDDVLAFYLESIGANLYRGSETDLVERYYLAAKLTDAKKIIRICADNPLICASEIDRLIDFFESEPCDYAYNHIPIENHYPDGVGAEICAMQMLEVIQQKASTPEQREHLFNLLWDNREDYSIKTFEPPREIAHPELKLDLDTIDDYQRLFEKKYRINMSANEIIQTALQDKR